MKLMNSFQRALLSQYNSTLQQEITTKTSLIPLYHDYHELLHAAMRDILPKPSINQQTNASIFH